MLLEGWSTGEAPPPVTQFRKSCYTDVVVGGLVPPPQKASGPSQTVCQLYRLLPSQSLENGLLETAPLNLK